MGKIIFIAPDKALYKKGQDMIKRLSLENEVEIYLSRLGRAVKLACSLQNDHVDVIISRGGTASLLRKENLTIPLVDIRVTGQDLAKCFHESKKKTGLVSPKIALFAFENMKEEVEGLSSILNVSLSLYKLEKKEDISTKVNNLLFKDADIIVGGMSTAVYARKKGFQACVIHSGDFAIKNALLEAKRIVNGRKIEKKRTQMFKALIDYSTQGVIGVDDKGLINVFNEAAEKLLEIEAKNIIGKSLSTLFPFYSFPDLKEKNELGETKIYGTKTFLFHKIPIIVDEKMVGGMIAFQDITHIQKMEEKIRKDIGNKNLTASYTFQDMFGISEELDCVKRTGLRMAKTEATVLISGESGTGKELLAQSIHSESERRNGPFVAINCAALPSSLLESELFGYEEGAFTGARRKGKKGLFELAHRGTIFLDELGEMDASAQSRLLRVLQEKQFMRVGGHQYISTDVRVIAATNQNLVESIQKGTFREDLFYRLHVLSITIPPLRDRKSDIPYLARLFLQHYNEKYKRTFSLSEDAYKMLEKQQWLGNVRELKHFIEKLVVVEEKDRVKREDISHYFGVNSMVKEQEEQQSLKENEKEKIREVVKGCDGNISKAARLLGINRSTLYRKLRKYHIKVEKSY
ncbi:Fis family transcriptional regulator [Bacillus endophyticus]|uniref:sigma-54-dependent Fis family transcriptional regulator n=1 Tax=Priestia endophytica TaxID=135735 RepID=UPI0018CD9D86|nr:sigma-54-dependent Fis family transcriptional regulator [Priestia endophytica]MBG9814034.1 Fis family transcriptional regulator [Priestia endophytica]